MKQTTEEDLKTKTCPAVNRPCLLDACLAFQRQESVDYDETELKVVLDEHTGERRAAEVTTGRHIQGDIAACQMGFFRRALLNLKVTESSIPAGTVQSMRERETNLLLPEHFHGEES